MLVVIGAMMALSIDVVTFYTARSEAQLASDSAALAAARVLANSGMTSDATLTAGAEALATTVSIQVALQNQVGGRKLTLSDVGPPVFGGNPTNPTVTIHVQRSDLPTFFARIWGSTQVTVAASATAEAYNPSGARALGKTNPVAPTCVKPWLLPNRDPSNGGAAIFDPVSGAITAGSNLLGWSSSTPATGVRMRERCTGGNCAGPPAPPETWRYYPGDDATTFPHPTNSLPTCSLIPTLSDYQKSIVGCIQTPISCNSSANIDISNYSTRNTETAKAVNCLTHAATGNGDTVTTNTTPPPAAPFEFVAGADNPIAGLAGSDVMVSDSLVTVPVFDVGSFAPPSNAVTIVGFVQLFLNPDGLATPIPPAPNGGHVNTTVINIAGCGTGATGTPILGNGASPVAVRLISP